MSRVPGVRAGAGRPRALSDRIGGLLLLTLPMTFPPISHAQDQDEPDQRHRPLRVSTGANFSSGDYGQEGDTDIYYVPISFRYDQDPFIVKLTVPYIRIRGPGGVVGGTQGALVVGDSARGRETHHGLGDVVASVSYVYLPPGAAPSVEFTGKVKFPTADEDDELGTGEFDYTVQIDLAKTLGPVTPFVTVGYRFLGDPSDFDLNDTVFASLGTSIRFSGALSGGIVYDWRESSTSDVGSSHELVPFATWKFNERYRLSGYGIAGLSSGAADWGGGLSLGVDF